MFSILPGIKSGPAALEMFFTMIQVNKIVKPGLRPCA